MILTTNEPKTGQSIYVMFAVHAYIGY